MTTSTDTLLAGDRRWQWIGVGGDNPSSWRFRWPSSSALNQHLMALDRLGDDYRLLSTTAFDDRSQEASPTGLTPLSRLDISSLSPTATKTLFESLGRWLRRLHDHPSPEGFGPIHLDRSFHTFNAFMADYFRFLSVLLRKLEDDQAQARAVDLLANLRNELGAFHPHGKSSWTAGSLSPSSIAIDSAGSGVAGVLDFSSAALRPPEYDVACLRSQRLFTDSELARRAFWRGYGAAKTCDLERRVAYFERIIELEVLLNYPERPTIHGDEEYRL